MHWLVFLYRRPAILKLALMRGSSSGDVDKAGLPGLDDFED